MGDCGIVRSFSRKYTKGVPVTLSVNGDFTQPHQLQFPGLTQRLIELAGCALHNVPPSLFVDRFGPRTSGFGAQCSLD